jgi:hypothetical protein
VLLSEECLVARLAPSVCVVLSARERCDVSRLGRWSVCGRSGRVDLGLYALHREGPRQDSGDVEGLQDVQDL